MQVDKATERLRELVGQCRSTSDVRAFLHVLAAAVNDLIDGYATTFWTLQGENLVLTEEVETRKGILEKLWVSPADQSWAMKESFQKGTPTVFRPGELDLDKSHTVVFLRVNGIEGPVGLLRVVLPVLDEADLNHRINLAQSISGYCSIFEAGRVFLRHTQEREKVNRLMKVLSEVHANSLSDKLGTVLVNGAAEVTGAERVSLCVQRRPGKLKVEAVSSVDAPDQKSAWARLLNELGLPAMAIGKPIVFFDGATDISAFDESVQEKLSAYVQMSGAKALALFPLRIEDRSLGILVFESWKPETFGPMEQALGAAFAVHAAVTVDNCLFVERLPLSKAVKKMYDRRRGKDAASYHRRTSPWLPVLVFFVVAAVIALVHRVDEEISAECLLEPSRDATIVSEIDGRIAQVAFSLGDQVQEDQLLMELDTQRLGLAREKILAEIANIQKNITRLRGEAALLPQGSEDQGSRMALAQSGEKEEIAKRKELELVEAELRDSKLRAPIMGRIIEPDRPETLRGMVVRAGEPLCRISTLDPMVVKVAIPQKDVLRVDVGARVRMALPSLYGERELEGKIDHIQLRSSNYKNANVFVAHVYVENPGESLLKGMTGKARVYVGKSTYASIAARRVAQKFRYWLY